MREAQRLSKEHPDTFVRVMDKKDSEAVVNKDINCFWQWKREGFKTVAAFFNGREVMI